MKSSTRHFRILRGSLSLRGVLLLVFICLWAMGYFAPRLEACHGITSNLDNALQLEVQRRQLIGQSKAIIAPSREGGNQQQEGLAGPVDELAIMRILDDITRQTKVELARISPSQDHVHPTGQGAGASVDIRSEIKPLIQFLYLVEYGQKNLAVSFLKVRLPAQQGKMLDVSLTINQEGR